jgi:protein TonB
VSFTVLPNGTISGARVSQSSGNEWLDKAAVQAVNATSGALPFPAGIHKARWDFALKVNFKLDW